MSLTDRLNFSQEKLFKILSDNLLKSDGKTRNLIDCKENILFAWDSKTKRLFTQNIKYFKDKDAGFYQVRLCFIYFKFNFVFISFTSLYIYFNLFNYHNL